MMIRAAAVLACTILVGACSQTPGAGAHTTMLLTGYAFPPPAFQPFCAKQGALCSTSGGKKVVELTSARKTELSEVNILVNRRIAERSDIQTTGKADEWDLPKNQGDCEDFAILKKSELLKRGWPASALLLTVARSGVEGHTVLTARTSEGDLILDNRTSDVRDWSRTSYRYFARQSQSNGRSWERIGSARRL
jgi:predicted transglutaminase-like cysteine proteinase